jgi:hypothetical protein
MDAITVGLPILNLGKNIQVFDPISIILFLAGVTRLVFGAQKSIGAPQWLLVSFLILMSVPLGLGFKQYGMGAAPDFRWFFHFLAATLYASSFNFDQINFSRLAKYLLWGGAILILLAFFRWAAWAAGLAIAETWRAVGANRDFRVLNASQTFFIAQVGLMLLIIRVSERGETTGGARPSREVVVKESTSSSWHWEILFSGLCLAVAFALLHRSVWVSTTAGMLMLAYFDRKHRKELLHIFSTFFVVGCTVLIPLGLTGFLNSFFEGIGSAFSETTEHHSTFADRYLGWRALLGEWWASGNILTYALGLPFGSGYYRKIAEFGASYWVEYTPHNFYVQTLLRTGVIGLMLFLSLLASTGLGAYNAVSKFKKVRGREFGVRLFLLLSIFMQVVFFLVYGARLEQGLLFGLAMAAATFTTRMHNRSSLSPKRLMSCPS